MITMTKKETFKFWDNFYERCSKCNYSIGHAIKKDCKGKLIHNKCPRCGVVMIELSNEEKEFMYTRM